MTKSAMEQKPWRSFLFTVWTIISDRCDLLTKWL
jgi:hypothetical protein